MPASRRLKATTVLCCNARPPRTKLLGFIPWKRQSTALGFSQALDGTWAQYKRVTGRWTANRTDFSDAVRFIAWYHAESNRKNGIALTDTYRLYIAYYHGHAGYSRGNWSGTPATGARSAGGDRGPAGTKASDLAYRVRHWDRYADAMAGRNTQ